MILAATTSLLMRFSNYLITFQKVLRKYTLGVCRGLALQATIKSKLPGRYSNGLIMQGDP